MGVGGWKGGEEMDVEGEEDQGGGRKGEEGGGRPGKGKDQGRGEDPGREDNKRERGDVRWMRMIFPRKDSMYVPKRRCEPNALDLDRRRPTKRKREAPRRTMIQPANWLRNPKGLKSQSREAGPDADEKKEIKL